MENGLEIFIKWINYPFVHVGDSPVTASGLFVSLAIVVVAVIVSGFVQRLRPVVNLPGAIRFQ